MLNRKAIATVLSLALCAIGAAACGDSSKSAAETAPAKEMDQSSQGSETTPDGTSSADDQPSSTHTMPDGTTMENEDMPSK